MSILIKGMEMPRNCYNCWLGLKCPKYEALLWNEINKERKADCPLVPVPAHGDLIDRNNLLMIINQIKGQAESPEIFVLEAVERAIKSRRAIIPGEEGKT